MRESEMIWVAPFSNFPAKPLTKKLEIPAAIIG